MSDSLPTFTIIIPTRDAPDVFDRCLKSIFEKTCYPDFEVIVMDNDTTDPASLTLMKNYPVRRIPFPGRFNFSQANNQGAAAAIGKETDHSKVFACHVFPLREGGGKEQQLRHHRKSVGPLCRSDSSGSSVNLRFCGLISR